MSWVTDVQNDFTITTGDGKSFDKLLWRNSTIKEIVFNTAQFDFPGVEGSMVYRGTNQAKSFNLDIFFQGDNNFALAKDFELSSLDPRPWTVSHPIHGRFYAQPLSVKFDYSGYNICWVAIALLETITGAGPIFTVVPKDKIVADQTALSDKISQRYLSIVPKPVTKDIKTLSAYNQALYNIGNKIVKLNEDAGTYTNLVNKAASGVLNLLNDASSVILLLQNVINFPALIKNTITNRLNTIQSQLDYLVGTSQTITRRTDKGNFEIYGTTLISSACTAAVIGYKADGSEVIDGNYPDYQTRASVVTIIGKLQFMMNTYLAALDALQTPNGGREDSYIPDGETVFGLTNLVNFTIENLYTIALSAKQERIVVLDADSNVIVLAHRFYGLLADDSTIDTIIANNNICLDEILQVKKGRAISYYI